MLCQILKRCAIRQTLADMGYSKGLTQVEKDNIPAKGFINETQKQRRLRTIEMNFYWLRKKTEIEKFIFHGDQAN